MMMDFLGFAVRNARAEFGREALAEAPACPMCGDVLPVGEDYCSPLCEAAARAESREDEWEAEDER